MKGAILKQRSILGIKEELMINENIDTENNAFSYGWVVVIASSILLIGSMGTQLCFGVFLNPASI